MSYKEYISGSMAFTPEEVEAKEHLELLEFLIRRGCEIHVTNDSYCTIVEWIDRVQAEDGFVFSAVAAVSDDLRKIYDLPPREDGEPL